MNPSDNLDQAISAAGLVLAVLAALYTLWLGDVGRALDLEPEPDKSNRGTQMDQVWSAFRTKGLPLFGASLMAVCILGPRACFIVAEFFAHRADWRYDDVKALFCLTVVLLVVLCVVAGAQAWSLVSKGRDLGK